MRKILVISHDASRTGAPILLINLAELLRDHFKCEVDFLFKTGGDLKDTLIQNWNARQFYTEKDTPFKSKFKRAKQKIGIKGYPFSGNSYSFVINNTITNGDILPFYKGSTIITYVHELSFTLDNLLDKRFLKNTIELSNIFLYPSEAVKSMLVSHLGIKEEKCMYLPYYVKDYLPLKDVYRREIRQQLNLEENDIVIGAMGTTDWRKGNDFFLFLSHLLKGNGRFKFIWVGSDQRTGNQGFNQMIHDKEKAGLSNLIMVPSVPDSWKYLAAMDIFFLTSREDPYPLVVLEAGMMQLPIICFEGSGGATEFVSGNCGEVVPYLDIEYAKNLLIGFAQDKTSFISKSKSARKKYEERHTIGNVMSEFEKVAARISTSSFT